MEARWTDNLEMGKGEHQIRVLRIRIKEIRRQRILILGEKLMLPYSNIKKEHKIDILIIFGLPVIS